MSLRFTPPVGSLFSRKTAIRAAALMLALTTSVACGSDDEGTPTEVANPVNLELSETIVTLVRGTSNTKQISANVTGTSNSAVTWTSFDPRIATVSQSGLITAVSDGQTHVTAVSQADPTLNRSVVVNVVSTIVATSPSAMYSYVGGPTRQLTATVTNNTNTAVTWRSSNEAVATVSSTGVVTPVGAGTADIIARSVGDPSKESAVQFTVDPAPRAGFTKLTSGQTVTVSGATGENANFYIEVPTGKTLLSAVLTGPTTQDADLYVYRADASASALTGLSSTGKLCSPWLADANEKCDIANPLPRIHYIIVNAYTAYQNAKLTVTISP